jgi:hypothetical protein
MYLIYTYIIPNLTLQVAPGYNIYNHGIAQVVTAKDDVRYATYENILRYRRASVEQYIQWKPFDGTMLVANNNVRYEHYANPNLGYRTHGWCDSYSLSLQQRLPFNLRLSLSAYGKMGHSPASVYAIQHSYFDYYASLQRSFLKGDKLTVRLTANAPFDRYWVMDAETVNGDFLGHERSWNRNRSFALSVSWRFGSLKSSVKKTEHSIDNDDVVGGISKGN